MATEWSATSADDPARRRTQMGQAIRGWGVLPGAVTEVAEDFWVVLSGAPSADVNIVLVQSPADEVLRRALATVQGLGVPALVCLAGEAAGRALPAGWQAVGSMPLMRADLVEVPQGADPRVRVAGPEDLEAMIALFVDAYGMEPAVARVAVEPVVTGRADGVADMRFWLLVDDGVTVSAVMDARVDDVVTVWCMATAPRRERRGHGRALLAHVLDAARRDGMTTGLLGATPAGKPLYAATGWSTVEEWQLYVNADSAQFA